MKRELVCIVCPIGCHLEVELTDGKVTSVIGNTCPRGVVYAGNECTNPKRTITTTVKCSNGEVLPVKTADPIAKEKIFEAMKVINKTVARTPVEAGDVIIDDVFGSELVATKNIK